MASVQLWVPPGPSPLELAGGAWAGLGAAVARPWLQAPVVRAMSALLRPPPSDGPGSGLSSGGPGSGLSSGGPGSGSSVSGAPGSSGQSTPASADSSVGASPADPGWFGPDSVAWRVHADASMLVAGLTAFALQALHPLALAGVVDHSSFADDFLGRTRRTGEFVSGVVFGSATEAAARVAQVRRVHDRVTGISPDGRPYSANEPELLAWVHVTEYLAIAATSRRFGTGALSRQDLDQYVAEVAVTGEAMGVPNPPRSWRELMAAFDGFRPQLAAGEAARAALRFLRSPPGLAPAAVPVWHVLWAGATVCLPPVARRLFVLRSPRPDQVVAARALIRSLSALLGPPPPLAAARRRLGLCPSP